MAGLRRRAAARRRDARRAHDAAGRARGCLRRRLPPDAGRRLRLRPGHVPRPDATGAQPVMTVGARPARPAPWPGVLPDVTGVTRTEISGDEEAVRRGLRAAGRAVDAPDVVFALSRYGRRTVRTGGTAPP